MTPVEQEVRLRGLIHGSWEALRELTPVPDAMPRHHALHVAHTTGFSGGLIAAGLSPALVERIASAEIERYGEHGP
jgi:hypothetical protein